MKYTCPAYGSLYLDEEVREGNEREEAKGLVGDGSWKSVTLFYLQKMSS